MYISTVKKTNIYSELRIEPWCHLLLFKRKLYPDLIRRCIFIIYRVTCINTTNIGEHHEL